jgi:hypothetical protein
LPAIISEWWYLDLVGATSKQLRKLKKFSCRASNLLPLAPTNPFSFCETRATDLLQQIPKDGKRVIVDSVVPYPVEYHTFGVQ